MAEATPTPSPAPPRPAPAPVASGAPGAEESVDALLKRMFALVQTHATSALRDVEQQLGPQLGRVLQGVLGAGAGTGLQGLLTNIMGLVPGLLTPLRTLLDNTLPPSGQLRDLATQVQAGGTALAMNLGGTLGGGATLTASTPRGNNSIAPGVADTRVVATIGQGQVNTPAGNALG